MSAPFFVCCRVLVAIMLNYLHNLLVDVLNGADLSIGCAVDRVPLLLSGYRGGIVISLLQIVRIGFVDILCQTLF